MKNVNSIINRIENSEQTFLTSWTWVAYKFPAELELSNVKKISKETAPPFHKLSVRGASVIGKSDSLKFTLLLRVISKMEASLNKLGFWELGVCCRIISESKMGFVIITVFKKKIYMSCQYFAANIFFGSWNSLLTVLKTKVVDFCYYCYCIAAKTYRSRCFNNTTN